jgi:hypothetical protein
MHRTASVEIFFSLLKRERIRRQTYPTREDAKIELFAGVRVLAMRPPETPTYIDCVFFKPTKGKAAKVVKGGENSPCPSCKYNRAAFVVIFALSIMLQFCHTDGAGYRHGETQQYHPSPAVQQVLFQADPYSTICAFCKYDNN